MKFRYRGVLYKYYLSQTKGIFPSVLHYQKMVYSLEIQSSDCSPEISPAKLPGSRDRDRQILGQLQYWLLLFRLCTKQAYQRAQLILNYQQQAEDRILNGWM